MLSIARLIIAMAIAETLVTGSQLPIKVYTTADGLVMQRV
jgi:hypothetical protein